MPPRGGDCGKIGAGTRVGGGSAPSTASAANLNCSSTYPTRRCCFPASWIMAKWWDGARLFFAYNLGGGAAENTTDGAASVAGVPSVTLTRRPPVVRRASTGAPALPVAPANRWYVCETRHARGRERESPSLSIARPQWTSPTAPPQVDEGARVRRSAAPLWLTARVTGGALLSDGRSRLYGYSQGRVCRGVPASPAAPRRVRPGGAGGGVSVSCAIAAGHGGGGAHTVQM